MGYDYHYYFFFFFCFVLPSFFVKYKNVKIKKKKNKQKLPISQCLHYIMTPSSIAFLHYADVWVCCTILMLNIKNRFYQQHFCFKYNRTDLGVSIDLLFLLTTCPINAAFHNRKNPSTLFWSNKLICFIVKYRFQYWWYWINKPFNWLQKTQWNI